jgi:hypothetical protein
MEMGMFRFEGDFKEALGCLKRILGWTFRLIVWMEKLKKF